MAAKPGKIAFLMLTGVVLAGAASLPLLAQDAAPTAPDAAVAAPADPVTAPAEAPAEPPVAADPVADLAAIEASISLSHERVDQLKAEIAAMEGDQTKQNAALIAAAQRVKLAEIEVVDVEDRLSELIVSELAVRGRLDGSNGEIANVLAALERISLNPPPALIVDPDDALGSARSAMLIAAIVPQLRAKADAVRADLKTLTDIKAAALAEEATLKANYSVLEEEQLRIATLIAARKQGIGVRTSELEAEEQQAVALADKALTLKELVESLSAQANSVSNASANRGIDPDAPTMSTEQIVAALSNSARTEPGVPFGAGQGLSGDAGQWRDRGRLWRQ